MKNLKIILQRFSPYFKDYIKEFSIAIVGMIFAAGGSAATAYLIKPVMDKIFIEKNEQLLYILPFAVVLVYFLKGAGKFIQIYYTAYIGQDIVRRIRNRMLENILSLDLSFFHKFRSGELISRSINDIERIRAVVSSMIPEMAREALTIIALIGYVIYLSPKLSFFALIILPLALWPLSKLAKKMKKISHKSQEKISDLTSRLSEIFNNIEIIKANAAEKFEIDKFKHDNEKYFYYNLKAIKTNELVSPLMETLGAVAVAAVIIVGGREVISDQMSVGSFFSFTAALFMLYTPIKRISSLYNKMQDAVAASERIFYIIDQIPNIKSGNKKIDKINEIAFDNVSLKYEDKEALKNINFSVKKGESVALIGESGGGKSSIVNLILRFYDPSSGKITLNGIDLKEFDLKSLREKISVVTQRIYIFNDTIAANVAYGDKIDKERVKKALIEASAWDFVKNMPQGMDTKINEFGTNLSGGQRQRIAIARAIYKDPEILILDEATSALDRESEQNITKALENFRKDRITFIIAHRFST
ncbi:MAG: ABC transporter ATP-binding protein, partial [Epsilonproteobacteria bacterium]|nr:ABC transporter ATP-binding protein [Campylobacterota bacterium]